MPQKSEFKKQPKIVKFMLVKIYVIKPKRKKKKDDITGKILHEKVFPEAFFSNFVQFFVFVK